MGTVRISESVPFITKRLLVGDTVRVFSVLEKTDPAGKVAEMALITVVGNPVTVAFGIEPSAGSNGLGHKFLEGDTIELKSRAAVDRFMAINTNEGNDAYLDVTFFN